MTSEQIEHGYQKAMGMVEECLTIIRQYGTSHDQLISERSQAQEIIERQSKMMDQQWGIIGILFGANTGMRKALESVIGEPEEKDLPQAFLDAFPE